MPSAETLAILRDLFAMAIIAWALAAVLYSIIRHYTDLAWNVEGNVLSRPYATPDAIVALLLLAMFGAAFFAPQTETGSAGSPASAPLTLTSLLLQSISMLLLCVVALAYLKIVRGLNPAEMFGLRQMSVKRSLSFAVLALMLTVVGISVGTAVLLAWNGGEMPDNSAQEAVAAFEKSGTPFRLMLGFIAIITAPITEELLFRGFLYGVVKKSTDRWFAAFFTALIFAVVHFHVGTAPQLFMLGLGLAIAYEQTGCLMVPVFMHAIFNGWNVGMLTWTAASN